MIWSLRELQNREGFLARFERVGKGRLTEVCP